MTIEEKLEVIFDLRERLQKLYPDNTLDTSKKYIIGNEVLNDLEAMLRVQNMVMFDEKNKMKAKADEKED
jgi:hypothetical protein